MKTKILVTGANGQLGQTFQELNSKSPEHFDFTFVSRSELDISDEEAVTLFFTNHAFDYCINCAAYTNVEQAEKTPDLAYSINADAVKNLATACKQTNTVLIHISTDYVFDGSKPSAYTIDDVPHPINSYGKSKRQGEVYIQELLDAYFIVRTSWLYSKTYGHNFYKTILNKAKAGDPLAITTEQVGCPTNASNLAAFILQMISFKSQDYGLYHFCDERPMTWYDFAKQIIEENGMLDTAKLVPSDKYITLAKRPKNSVLKNN